MLPFRDRHDAGRQLADRVSGLSFQSNVLVLALPRGGVPVAEPVARALHARLDVLIVRKLGVPGQPELAMGAICNDVRVLDDLMVRRLGITAGEIERITDREQAELERRAALYRPPGRPPPEVKGASVLVVDDGVATGSTMAAACRALRAQHPAEIVVAVPVAAPQAVDMLENLADRVVCLHAPGGFGAVGAHYLDFGQTSDAEVRNILATQ